MSETLFGRRIVLWVLGLINIVLILGLILSDNGVFSYLNLRNKHSVLESRLQQVREESVAVSREIRLLQSDPDYQEKVVRERTNFVKDNEILYIFPEAAGQALGEKDYE